METCFAKDTKEWNHNDEEELPYLIKAFLDVAFEIWQFSSSK